MAADSLSTQPPTAASLVASHGQNSLESLRDEYRRNQLQLKVHQQRAQLRAIGQIASVEASRQRDTLEGAFNYWSPDNFVNLMDYVGNGPYGYSLVNSPWLSTRADRDFGRNRPIFQTEMDLMAYRGAGRLLVAYNANAKGAVENLTNYVIGKDANVNAVPTKFCDDTALVDSVQDSIDRFAKRNNWRRFSKDKFQQSRPDGEYFVGLWHRGDGEVDARRIEPEQVTQPYSHREIEEWLGQDHHAVDWTFGVCADDEDSQSVHGYYVQWTNRDTDWDFLPGGNDPYYPPGTSQTWCEHFKLNVPINVKRGLGDFLPIQELLNLARKIQINMGTATSISAAIAWIIEHAPGILTQQIQSMIQQNSMASYTQGMSSGSTGSNSRTNYVQQYNGGTILHTKEGQNYKNAPGADNADDYINVVEAMLRAASRVWCMPDHFITGSADEVNYAAILEVGSPFVKWGESQQQDYGESDERVFWKVVEWNCQAGRVRDGQGRAVDFATVKRLVEIKTVFPRIDVRDEGAETTRNETLKKNGVMSRKTWAGREGLDFDQEEADGATDEVDALYTKKSEGNVNSGANGGRFGEPSGNPPSPIDDLNPRAARPATESLHERAGSLLTEAVDKVFGEAGIYP